MAYCQEILVDVEIFTIGKVDFSTLDTCSFTNVIQYNSIQSVFINVQV
jgi:hypothetical protein